MAQEIQQKPFQSYFNRFYLTESDHLETFERRYLAVCAQGVAELAFRFTEHPTFLRMRGEIREAGFTTLLARRLHNTPERIQRLFLEACQSGCHEVVERLVSTAQKTSSLYNVFLVGFDHASRGCFESVGHIRARFIKTVEILSESSRCGEITDLQLSRVGGQSPLLKERWYAISSTREVMEQLRNMSMSGSPIPPSTTSVSPPSASP